MPNESTKDQILTIASDILVSDGLAAVSFDAIARQLGRSKQAVLYWYPTKHELLAAMFLPWLEAEAEVAIEAISEATTREEAIDAFVRAVGKFHFHNLDRFRMMYLLPQTIPPSASELSNTDLLEKIHPVTDRMYNALANELERGPVTGRLEAFAIHSATLGLMLMFGLSKSLRDPLKHNFQEVFDALIASLQSR